MRSTTPLVLLRHEVATKTVVDALAAIRVELASQGKQHQELLATLFAAMRELYDDRAAADARLAELENELYDENHRFTAAIDALEAEGAQLRAERAALEAQLSKLARANERLQRRDKPMATVTVVSERGLPKTLRRPVEPVVDGSNKEKKQGLPPARSAERAKPAPLPVRAMVVKRGD